MITVIGTRITLTFSPEFWLHAGASKPTMRSHPRQASRINDNGRRQRGLCSVRKQSSLSSRAGDSACEGGGRMFAIGKRSCSSTYVRATAAAAKEAQKKWKRERSSRSRRRRRQGN